MKSSFYCKKARIVSISNLNLHLLSFLVIFLINVNCNSNFANAQLLDQKVQQLANSEAIKRGTVALTVVNTENDQILYQFNGDKYVTPASIQKLITTSAAVSKLGADFKFSTAVFKKGTIENGSLQGDIIISGTGDPTFCTDRFDSKYELQNVLNEFLAVLINEGINSINGNIYVDASYFDAAIASPKWLFEDIGNYYGAGASGFNFNENKYEIEFRSNQPGGLTEILNVYPKTLQISLNNEVLSGEAGSRDNAYVYGIPFSNNQYIRGTIPPNKSTFIVKGAMPDAANTFALTLKDFLHNNGIHCSGVAKSNYNQNFLRDGAKNIKIFYSPNLSEIVYWTNFKSINLYAESLLKKLNANNQTTGSTLTGVDYLNSFVEQHGFNGDHFKLYDGSGLSPSNRLTTNAYTQLLAKIYKSNYFPTIEESLSIAGHSEKNGYLRSMLRGTSAANNLKAKSGYMEGVRSYAGYVTDKANRKLAFALVVNNYDCSAAEMRKLMEPILLQVAELNY